LSSSQPTNVLHFENETLKSDHGVGVNTNTLYEDNPDFSKLNPLLPKIVTTATKNDDDDNMSIMSDISNVTEKNFKKEDILKTPILNLNDLNKKPAYDEGR
jgi:hypothetical protein